MELVSIINNQADPVYNYRDNTQQDIKSGKRKKIS